MRVQKNHFRPFGPLLGSIVVCLACITCALYAESPRVNLTPRFNAGESMVYTVETSTNTTGKAAGPIENPETPSQASLNVDLRVRLEVLSLSNSPEGNPTLRLRATWETSRAQSSSDAVNPAAPDPAVPFAKLEGRSLEFSLAANGAITQLHGLEGVIPGGVPPTAAIMWVSSLVSGYGFPRDGIAQGRQWSAEQPMDGVPLAGLFWKTQSSFLRSEACKPAVGNSAAPPNSRAPFLGQCAVILSRLSISRHGSAHADATPPDYVHNGLRTVGTWTGSGEGLGSISLSTGLLVSATETSTQDYDYEIRSESAGTSIHYTGKINTQTSITLLSVAQ